LLRFTINLVRGEFPQTLLIARELVAWGETARVLNADNLTTARHMCETFDESAAACRITAE
jgi:zinc/manganese transport system ATP-binding protein